MNNSLWFCARNAGFLFWEREPWKPSNSRIDWSTDYDEELQAYTKLVVLKTLEEAEVSPDTKQAVLDKLCG